MTFKKGQSGNPGGRPRREWTWGQLLEDVGNEVEVKTGKKFKDLVTRRLWVDAVNGSLGAQKEILNRMDGMPIQKSILAGDEENPIHIDVTKQINKIYGEDDTDGEMHKDS